MRSGHFTARRTFQSAPLTDVRGDGFGTEAGAVDYEVSIRSPH